MPDLAQLTDRRAVLPYRTDGGHTVTVHNGDIYLNARRVTPGDALELASALGRAVTDIAEQRIAANPNHTNSQEANHG